MAVVERSSVGGYFVCYYSNSLNWNYSSTVAVLAMNLILVGHSINAAYAVVIQVNLKNAFK